MGFLKTGGASLLVLALIPLLTLSLFGISINPLLSSETYLTLAQEQNMYEHIAQELSKETGLTFTPQQTEAAFAPLFTNSMAYLVGETETLTLTLVLPQELLVSAIADTLTELPPCSSGEDPFTPELHCKPLEKTKEAFAREVIAQKGANETTININEVSPDIKQSLDEARPYLLQARTLRAMIYGSTLILLALLIVLTLPPRSMLRWVAVPCMLAGGLLFISKNLLSQAIAEGLTELTYPALTTFVQALTTLVLSNLTLYASISIGVGAIGIITSFFLPDTED